MDVYISPARGYRVIAMSGEGGTLWAWRVAWPRPPFPGGGRQQMIDSFVASGSGDEPINVDEVDWPPDFSAVGALATDGQGRLYVFALEEMDDLFTRPASWPAAVYSPSGDFISPGIAAAPRLHIPLRFPIPTPLRAAPPSDRLFEQGPRSTDRAGTVAIQGGTSITEGRRYSYPLYILWRYTCNPNKSKSLY